MDSFSIARLITARKCKQVTCDYHFDYRSVCKDGLEFRIKRNEAIKMW